MTEERIIAYLLGSLPEDELERFEEECFAQEDWPDELAQVEEDLVDDYLRDELTAEQRRLFRQNYLTTDARRERVALAAALLRHVDEEQAAPVTTRAQAPDKPAEAGWWNSFWGGRPWAMAAAALAVVVVVAGVWWLARSGPAPSPFVALTLNVSRGDRSVGAEEGSVKLPRGTRELRLTLKLPEGSAQAAGYRAELLSEGGEPKPSEVTGQNAQTVSVSIPAARLSGGSYAVRLYSAAPGGEERRVPGNYYFKVE